MPVVIPSSAFKLQSRQGSHYGVFCWRMNWISNAETISTRDLYLETHAVDFKEWICTWKLESLMLVRLQWTRCRTTLLRWYRHFVHLPLPISQALYSSDRSCKLRHYTCIGAMISWLNNWYLFRHQRCFLSSILPVWRHAGSLQRLRQWSFSRTGGSCEQIKSDCILIAARKQQRLHSDGQSFI